MKGIFIMGGLGYWSEGMLEGLGALVDREIAAMGSCGCHVGLFFSCAGAHLPEITDQAGNVEEGQIQMDQRQSKLVAGS